MLLGCSVATLVFKENWHTLFHLRIIKDYPENSKILRDSRRHSCHLIRLWSQKYNHGQLLIKNVITIHFSIQMHTRFVELHQLDVIISNTCNRKCSIECIRHFDDVVFFGFLMKCSADKWILMLYISCKSICVGLNRKF